MAVVEVTVLPIGTAESSLSKHVAAALKPLEESGLKYEMSSMGTNIEGPLEQILEVVMQMHETPFEAGLKRVLTRIVIDDRRDKEVSIEGKKKSVMGKR
ncbi:MAG: MTH1187 family thiamine-binding protein [bacterium]